MGAVFLTECGADLPNGSRSTGLLPCRCASVRGAKGEGGAPQPSRYQRQPNPSPLRGTRKISQASEENAGHGDPPGSLAEAAGGSPPPPAVLSRGGPGGSGPMIQRSRKGAEDSFRPCLHSRAPPRGRFAESCAFDLRRQRHRPSQRRLFAFLSFRRPVTRATELEQYTVMHQSLHCRHRRHRIVEDLVPLTEHPI